VFNEDYHSASAETAVRIELCREAMRLTAVLREHPLGKTPPTHALAALMCLDVSRLPARVDAAGNLSSLFDQHRSQWDQELIAEGLKFLELSATGSELTEYPWRPPSHRFTRWFIALKSRTGDRLFHIATN
jgi:predicted RNA polymerase sigma factor